MPQAVRFDAYGGRDVLPVVDVELAEPAAGRVVVQVEAAGVNPGQAAIRCATYPVEQVQEAYAVVEDRRTHGIVVLVDRCPEELPWT